MFERIRKLNLFKKIMLLLMTLMLAVFAFVYAKTVNRVGFLYRNAILVPQEEKGSRTYSGKIEGKEAVFTVSPDKTVTFQHGTKVYGPYGVKEDPAAVPQNSELKERMRGVEIRRGEELVFRGGMLEYYGQRLLFEEDGSSHGEGLIGSGSWVVLDENGNVIDPMEPTASAILSLAFGPTLTHKGDWTGWLCALLICTMAAVLILFEEELFRWSLRFRIRDPEQAEPSEWEIASRYIGPVLFLAIAAGLCFIGLR